MDQETKEYLERKLLNVATREEMEKFRQEMRTFLHQWQVRAERNSTPDWGRDLLTGIEALRKSGAEAPGLDQIEGLLKDEIRQVREETRETIDQWRREMEASLERRQEEVRAEIRQTRQEGKTFPEPLWQKVREGLSSSRDDVLREVDQWRQEMETFLGKGQEEVRSKIEQVRQEGKAFLDPLWEKIQGHLSASKKENLTEVDQWRHGMDASLATWQEKARAEIEEAKQEGKAFIELLWQRVREGFSTSKDEILKEMDPWRQSVELALTKGIDEIKADLADRGKREPSGAEELLRVKEEILKVLDAWRPAVEAACRKGVEESLAGVDKGKGGAPVSPEDLGRIKDDILREMGLWRQGTEDSLRKVKEEAETVHLRSRQVVEASLRAMGERIDLVSEGWKEGSEALLRSLAAEKKEPSQGVAETFQQEVSLLREGMERIRAELKTAGDLVAHVDGLREELTGRIPERFLKVSEETASLKEDVRDGFSGIRDELGALARFSYADLEKRINALETRIRSLEKLTFR